MSLRIADQLFGGPDDDMLNSSDGIVDNDSLDGGPNVIGDSCDSDPDPEVNCEL